MIWQLLDSRTVGGIEKHVELVTRSLVARGVDARIMLLAAYEPHPSFALFQQSGLPVQRLSGGLRGLLGSVRAARPALIHAHGYRANILARLVRLRTGTPIVTSYHAGLREPAPVGLYQRLDEWTGFLAPRIAVSEDIRRSLPFRAELLENFIEMPTGPPRPGNRIVFVGRLVREKGADLFCALARGLGGGEWHVYGDGPLRDPLEAEYGLEVAFHGFARAPETIWDDAGLLVMPSRAEGLPMAALEAIARGVPIVAARVGGLPRVAVPGVSGWLFAAGDLRAAGKAIAKWRAMTPAQRMALARSAQAHARAHFSAEAGMGRLAEIYARAAGHALVPTPQAGRVTTSAQ